jgi:hypothetical protein
MAEYFGSLFHKPDKDIVVYSNLRITFFLRNRKIRIMHEAILNAQLT